ncbi:DUF45 domain-containing protein [Clostridium malenominatum]|uniref:DUF45 domain-containing protein n=1 Tax=Clostridium malenominatum TaxID=1539 RepID=A0ABN1IUA7_9CLOT
MINYILIRKKVKNINLRIKRDGSVVVSANPKVPLEYINSFVESKEGWIIKHRERIKEIENRRKVQEDEIRILGHTYNLRDLNLEEGDLEKYIRELAKKEFNMSIERILPLLKDYKIKKPSLKIRKMKTRWGSCNKTKKSITLNLELLKYTREIIDYVVLHELVHLVYFDHSKNFYGLLEELMPDFNIRRKILKEK